MADKDAETPQLPEPDPALKQLEPFIGSWTMRGHTLDSTEDNIEGRVTYRWLPGGFFMEQHIELDFVGLKIDSMELIGYDPETKTFPSTVYSNLSPMSLPYRWEVDGGDVKITVSYGPFDSTFKGRFSENGKGFAGGWRPNPGADETVNVSYDVSGSRVPERS
jgi:hypothetical protein